MVSNVIVTSKENKDWLQKEFNCARSYISMALNFKTNSVLARKIRQAAMTQRKSFFVFDT